ncbi:MAG: hypothetical protein ACRC4M_04835 [Mycoplasma sp.]
MENIEKYLIENTSYINEENKKVIDLSWLRLKGYDLDISGLVADEIYNNWQNAELIVNKNQKAKTILNQNQLSKIEIDNKNQKASKSISNRNQKAVNQIKGENEKISNVGSEIVDVEKASITSKEILIFIEKLQNVKSKIPIIKNLSKKIIDNFCITTEEEIKEGYPKIISLINLNLKGYIVLLNNVEANNIDNSNQVANIIDNHFQSTEVVDNSNQEGETINNDFQKSKGYIVNIEQNISKKPTIKNNITM